MLRLILVDLRRHAARTGLTAVGIAVGVAIIVALLGLSKGIERSASGIIQLGGAELGMFQAGVGELTASSLPRLLVERVGEQRGVAEAAPATVATGELPGEPSFLVFGLDPAGFVLQRRVFIEGRRPRRETEAVVGAAAARELGLSVGETLDLTAGSYPIVGIYQSGVAFEDQGAVLGLETVGRMRGRENDATTIAIKLAPGARSAEVAQRLQAVFPGTFVISEPGQVERLDTNALLIRKAAVVFAGLALLVGGIVVTNTMLMAVFERRSDFALLLAIGWPRPMVARLVFAEGVLLSLVGAVLGAGLGVVAGEFIVRAVDASALVDPHYTAGTLGRAVLVALATGAVGSLYPAWWVTRLRPAEALE